MFWLYSREAREAGLPESVIAAIRSGAPPAMSDPRECSVYAIVGNFVENALTSDDTFSDALARLGTRAWRNCWCFAVTLVRFAWR